MKLRKDNGTNGVHGGIIHLSLLFEDIKLKHKDCSEEYVISLRDEIGVIFLPDREDNHLGLIGSFSLGKAKARITQKTIASGCRGLNIAIEAPNTADFIDLYNEVYTRIGIPHEEIPTPRHRLENLSFVRGIRNDFRKLGRFFCNRWNILRKAIAS